MAGCYTCIGCGKCSMPDIYTTFKVLVCMDCGKEVNPGESKKVCARCGSTNLEYRPKTASANTALQ